MHPPRTNNSTRDLMYKHAAPGSVNESCNAHNSAVRSVFLDSTLQPFYKHNSPILAFGGAERVRGPKKQKEGSRLK